jgi:N-(2-amino-2-carboxyethyl)-L-glutamate synthase
VVAIAPDLGERYLTSVYDDDWVTARGLYPAPESDALLERREQSVLL